ncbi:MAG TPA: hypothetical protein VFL57_18770 [Bryobacteraceae bacterium]|nr:hypothetical protein [Bryobacteraceae bacterium]
MTQRCSSVVRTLTERTSTSVPMGLDVKPPEIQPYGMKQLYVCGPDGYTLCLQWPASEQSRERWRTWYGTA